MEVSADRDISGSEGIANGTEGDTAKTGDTGGATAGATEGDTAKTEATTNSKFIFVTGGVSSSLGKGLTAASLGRLLKARGLSVTMLKLDPYINIDPGTLNPFEHGEVFVTEDGGETDLDLGHYERFIDENLTKNSNATSGSIYFEVLAAERRGDFLGKTVQVIPHITNEIKRRIRKLATPDIDVVIVEVGGTVGDIEILPFLEAIRQLRLDVGRGNVRFVHVTFVPYMGPTGEQKTKPTQHSVIVLRSSGIQPDAIVCRSDRPLPQDLKQKISDFCDVSVSQVANAADVDSIYEIPLVFHDEGLDTALCRSLNLAGAGEPDLAGWKKALASLKDPLETARIAIVGKYVRLPDAYLSVAEALSHSAAACGVGLELAWVDAEQVLDTGEIRVEDADGGAAGAAGAGNGEPHAPGTQTLADFDGVVLPGGFGPRGIEGKISTAHFTRNHDIPCLGLCLGMQAMTIEYARNQLGLTQASSTELDPQTPLAVIDLMHDQKNLENLGGTMRLGAYTAKLTPDSKAAQAYQATSVSERHRHRYELTTDCHSRHLDDGHFTASGVSPDGQLVEFIELDGHPFWLGTQAHPEFKSRLGKPAPLFAAFMRAAKERAQSRSPRLFGQDST